MKKVILISSLIKGGAERRAADLSNQLAERGHDISLVTLDKGVDFDISDKVKYYQVSNVDARTKKIIKIIYTPFQIFKIRQILKEIKPGIVLSFLERSSLLNIILKDNLNYKSIISVRNFPSKCYKGIHGFFFKRFLKYIVKRADKVIPNSNMIRDDLIKNFGAKPEKTITIYNPYDIERKRKLAEEQVSHPWFSEGAPVVINAGRLAEQKGQYHLIRAFSLVRKKKKAKLVILGEGKLEEYLKKLVSELGLNNDVAFLGWKENPFKYLAKAEIFVFSSLYEGFPNALAEAIICKTPVISTDCSSGPREMLEGGRHGILVPVGDGRLSNAHDKITKEEKILADKMIMLLEDEKLREKLRKSAFERIKHFSKERIMRQYEENLKEATL